MNPTASDLRYLKLTEFFEQAFERSIHDVAAKTAKDVSCRSKMSTHAFLTNQFGEHSMPPPTARRTA